MPKAGRRTKLLGQRTLNPNYIQALKDQSGNDSTGRSYKTQLNSYILYCTTNEIDPDNLNLDLPDVISRWLAKRIMIDSYGKSTMDQCYSAVKKYYSSKHLREGKIDKYLIESEDITELEQLYYQALFAVFFCWFRIDEAATLLVKDVSLFEKSPQDEDYEFHTIHLDHRKTNQTRERTDSYELHDSVDDPGLHVLQKISKWRTVYSQIFHQFNGVANFEDSFLFCKVDGSSLFPLQKMAKFNLEEIYIAAGVKTASLNHLGNFTTHAFRRGGAQYRFFGAKKKWPLSWIRKWGVWSKTERMNTLLNYILDDLAQREDISADYGSPFRRDHNLSILDQQTEQPDFFEYMNVIDRKFVSLFEKMDDVQSSILSQNRVSDLDSQVGEAIGITRVDNETIGHVGLPQVKGWEEAINWYTLGLPGFFGPMKNMLPNQRSKLSKKYSGIKYRFTNYKLIYDEFVRLDEDKESFEAEYEQTGLAMTPLLNEIRKNNKGLCPSTSVSARFRKRAI